MSKQISCSLDVSTGIYEFSDGHRMPLAAYHKYIEHKLGGEHPTEPVETSKAIFGARHWVESGESRDDGVADKEVSLS